ncbi:hypothetical protein [Acidocella aquatica]|nr:hypothetical protein [Acidocella aquatica]
MGRPQRLGHLRKANGHQEFAPRDAAPAAPALPTNLPQHGPSNTPGSLAPGGLAATEILCLPSPDWLAHRLTITGPRDAVAAFRQAAAGTGRIPWQMDYGRVEEDWSHKLLAPSPSADGATFRPAGISAQGARTAARQMRTALELLEARMQTIEAQRLCPLDLHALAPVPQKILALGPDHPESLAWLWANWGTTWPVRHVEEITDQESPGSSAEGQASLALRFVAADWTPWRIIAAVRERWPELEFSLAVLPLVE